MKRGGGLACRAVLLLWCLSPLAARAQETTRVTLNFVHADVVSVIKAVGMLAHKNFIIDPKVGGTIDIVSTHPVSRATAYRMLLAALRMQGFAAVPGPGGVKIVPEADAKHNFSPTVGTSVPVHGDRVITQVRPLLYASAEQLIPVLRPLISPNNAIAADPTANALVITDYAENIHRIDAIIDAVDQPAKSNVAVIALHYASAVDVAQQISTVLGSGGGAPHLPNGVPLPAGLSPAADSLVIDPDARTNSLIVRAPDPAMIDKVRRLAYQLDVPTSAGGNMHVIYLKNANAVDLAKTLAGILSGAPGAAAAPHPPAPYPSAPAAAPVTAGNSVIRADAATNSLIVTAPDNVYNSLRAVIDRLDVRPAEVYVEALIAEVTLNRAAELGVQWQSVLGQSGNSALVGGTNFSTGVATGGGGANLINLSAGIASGAVLPALGLNIGLLQRLTIGGQEVTGLTALARALEQDSNANILSTPDLLTLDNHDAKIVVGQNVPFITGSYAQTGAYGAAGTAASATVTPFQTIERKNVGLTLDVKPQITQSGAVKLTIYQEVSAIADTSNPAGIITNKRSLKSTVLVDNGQIIVLGGLIQDDVENAVDKVPVLGSIPILGGLFRYETRKRVKTNLMVFLRPIILRGPGAGAALTDQRYRYIMSQEGAAALPHRVLLPNYPTPTVPGPFMPKVAPQGPASVPRSVEPPGPPAAGH